MSNAERQRLFRQRHPGYHRNFYVPSDRRGARSAPAAAATAPRAAETPAETATSSFDPMI